MKETKNAIITMASTAVGQSAAPSACDDPALVSHCGDDGAPGENDIP